MCGCSAYELTWEEIVALYRLTLGPGGTVAERQGDDQIGESDGRCRGWINGTVMRPRKLPDIVAPG
jgi:hypothetical protein